MKRCHKCQTEWVSEKKQPGVKETCPKCNAYLHACINCRFHDKTKHNECHIPNTEWVGDRVGCNFCDEFEFADASKAGAPDTKKEKALNALGALFGGESDGTPPEGKDAFDKLFGG
jgi:hypothetical protein